jgi:serine/threonine protein kinase
MSPEQCRSDHKAIGPHTDIYSLGCILHEMASGQLPFVTKSPVEMVRMHIDSPVPKLSLRPGLNAPPAFGDFVARCMQKDPSDRFADSQEALLALNNLIEGASTVTDGSGLISTADLMRRRASLGSDRVRGGRVTVPQNQISGDDIPPPVVESQEIERPNLLAQDISQELPSIIATDTIPPGFGGTVKNVDHLGGGVNDTLPRPEERRDVPFMQRSVAGLPMPIAIAVVLALVAVLATFGVIFSSL